MQECATRVQCASQQFQRKCRLQYVYGWCSSQAGIPAIVTACSSRAGIPAIVTASAFLETSAIPDIHVLVVGIPCMLCSSGGSLPAIQSVWLKEVLLCC